MSDAATKDDVEEIVGRVVGEIAGSMMQMMAERFEIQDKKSDGLTAEVAELRTAINRIENKLDPTIDKVDDHEVRIKGLESAAA